MAFNLLALFRCPGFLILCFLILLTGAHRLRVSVMGEHDNWADSKRLDYGSKAILFCWIKSL